MTVDGGASDGGTAGPDVNSRLYRVRQAMRGSGIDLLVVTPSADLRYLSGYDALPLERLTALVVPADGEPVLLVPALERPEAERSPAARADIEIASYAEIDNAYAHATRALTGASRVAVSDSMPARHVFALQDQLPSAAFQPAGSLLSELRMRKGPDELAELRRAAAAVDRVHDRMSEILKVGRSERDVAADISDAILAEGHVTADFVIVGSGPHGASPHHTVSDRVIQAGEPVVVDIGGSVASGYCSDSTRTYAVGGEPDGEFVASYEVLLQAQRAQCDAVRPGVPAEDIDQVGRGLIRDAGYGDCFIHRTGHGIGLETHEAPYIVEGNRRVLEPGMVFSIEPGIYVPGRHGARIEDIVAVTEGGVERLNRTSRELSVVAG